MDNSNLHLSICGHAKHGKSTLAGRLTFEMNAVSPQQLKTYEMIAKQRGKDFNKFSMVFLQGRLETYSPKSGLLEDSSRTEFPAHGSVHIDGLQITLIDTPGFSRFLNNILYGIYLSDKAIVVVEASAGVANGSKAVCRILKAFEIPILCFCITKMDMVGYSQSRFEEVRDDIQKDLIEHYGFDQDIPIIPVSAIAGVGVNTLEAANSAISWYKGDTLLTVISRGKAARRPIGNKVRFAVEGPREIYSPPGVGTILVGTLEYGLLSVGQSLVAEPASTLFGQRIATNIRSIQLAKGVTNQTIEPKEAIEAKAVISVSVPSWKKAEAIRYFRHGGILGTDDAKPRTANRILAEVVFFEPDSIYSGKEYILHPHVTGTTARFQTIINKDLLNFDLLKDEYNTDIKEFIKAEIELKSPCCIETVSDFPRLSKFVVREMNRIIACGQCIEVLE